MNSLIDTTETVRQFVLEYFNAWSGTDEEAILVYYADDVVLEIPRARLQGKIAVRDNFVRPFISAFPGNLHLSQKMAFMDNLVAIEWIFEACHKGDFAGIRPSGRKLRTPGASFYEYDLDRRIITAGRIYFDFEMFLKQLESL